MLYRVILSHNQTDNIRKFPHGPQTVFVFDAPTAEDIKECEALGCRYVIMPLAGHRGMNRNTGLQFILQNFSPNYDDYVEFFDGDRFPTDYNPDKVLKLDEYMRDKGLNPEEILFMGDDIPDLQVMKSVGLPACPADAADEIKQISQFVSQRGGGKGCVRDVIERVLKVQGKWMTAEAYAW